jgi:hypothetical protein
MWFFFHRQVVRCYGKEIVGDCPRCRTQTRVMEIIEEQGSPQNLVAEQALLAKHPDLLDQRLNPASSLETPDS